MGKHTATDGYREITLQTRRGTAIPNFQAWELTSLDWVSASDLQKKYLESSETAVALLDPCPVYNCHGLTFASRRTQPDDKYIHQILQDDGYERVLDDKPQVGDVVVYVNKETADIDHTGIVVEIRNAVGFTSQTPMIWSKWGHGYEVFHNVNHGPYDNCDHHYYRNTRDGQSRS